jgi:hypothetical protein
MTPGSGSKINELEKPSVQIHISGVRTHGRRHVPSFMKSFLAFLFLVVVTLPPLLPAADSVDAARIDNKDAPTIDGILDPIWKQAGQLHLPSEGGNFTKLSKTQVKKLDTDIEVEGAVYRTGSPFTIEGQRYAKIDPSSYTIYFLHDDINLYVAVVTEDEHFVEGSNYDQTSDGFGMGLKARDNKILKYWLTWFRGKVNEDTDPEASGPPLDRERMCYDAEWRSKLDGSWNNFADKDKGYVFEFYLPLETLGGYKAGDQIPANIIMVDHDKNPGGKFDDRKTAFMKAAWGSLVDPGDLTVPNFIKLRAGEAYDSKTVGYTDIQNTLVAKTINPADAPRIDGDPSDPAWQSAYKLFFPSPIGRTWTISKARYNDADPSVYNVALLHDETYLYVSVTSDDQLIESAPLDQFDVDQESDGLTSFAIGLPERAQTAQRKEIRLSTLWYQLDAWGSQLDQVLIGSGRKPLGEHFRDIDRDGKKEELHFQSGIPHSPYSLDKEELKIQWAYSPLLKNQWNTPLRGTGYSLEYRIPLKSLGDLKPGEKTRANIVITDHDGNPKKRYNEFKTRYRSLWWGTDNKDLWEYDAAGNPQKLLDVPKDKERFIQLDAGTGGGTKGYRGKVSKYLNHFDAESDFVMTEDGNAKPSAVARGYSGSAAAIKASTGKSSSISLTTPGALDLNAFATLQLVVQSDQEKLPLQVVLKDGAGKTAIVAERTLQRSELTANDETWHKVVVPVAEIKQRAPELDHANIQTITLVFPETESALVDELAALTNEDILSNAIDFLVDEQVPATGLIRSFGGNKPAHTYDQAMALLALTDAGKSKEAQALAKAMIELQEKSGDAGFFYDSYSAIDKRIPQNTDSGVGPNTWMAYALAVYGNKYKDETAKAAADRVCKWILTRREVFQKFPKMEKGRLQAFWEKLIFWDQPERDEDWERSTASLYDSKTGGVWAAIQHDAEEGAPTRPDFKGHSRDRMLFWYSTEGVIDAQHLFELMTSLGYDYGDVAQKIKDWMFRGGENSGWNDGGFFNLGHNDFSGNDERIYLDTHTWGAMLAKLHGQDDKAQKALEKCNELLSTRPFQGTQLRGFNDSRYPENESIWFGGTAHYVAACSYLGMKEKAAEFASTLLKTQRLSGGWPHSSDEAYMTCFVRKRDGKTVFGHVDPATGIAYDDPANVGNDKHVLKSSQFPITEWTGYSTFHSAKDAAGETAWTYFALKDYSSGKRLPYVDTPKKN